MKLVEQYLTAVEYSLPLKKRQDIIRELRTLLLDDIEARFGDDPKEEELISAIEAFGSPGEVAARYRGGEGIISEAFREIYFLLLKVVFGAMVLAFTVLFLVEQATEPVSGTALFLSLITIPLRAITAGLTAAGTISLIFIFLTRFYGDRVSGKALSGTDWTVEDLKEIPVEGESTSPKGIIAGLVFGGITVLILLVYPEILSGLERLFESSGIILGHYIRTDLFRLFRYGIAALWLGELAVQIMIIREGRRSRKLVDAEAFFTALEMLFFGLMVFLPALYQDSPGTAAPAVAREIILEGPSWLGFRLIFTIVFLVSLAETAVWSFKKISRKLEEGE